MGTVLWFALLAERPLFDPDEGRNAEIPREMLSGGDWVIPHLDALLYLEKPALQYWLTALTFRVLGENEFAERAVRGQFDAARVLWIWSVFTFCRPCRRSRCSAQAGRPAADPGSGARYCDFAAIRRGLAVHEPGFCHHAAGYPG
jgi:hypothetical protein